MSLRRLLSYILLTWFLAGCSSRSTPNVAPTVICDPIDEVVITGSAVPVSCSVTDDETADEDLELNWQIESAPDGFDKSVELTATAAISVTPSVAGSYTLVLTADDGNRTTTAEVAFTVINNDPPVITCDAIEEPVPRDESVTLSCAVEDDGIPDGSVDLVWTQQAPEGVAEIDFGSMPSTTFTPIVEGNYLIKLTASDGNASSFHEFSLDVINTNTAPEINCPDTTLRIAVGKALPISCSFTDDGKRPGAPEVSWLTKVSPTGMQNPEYPADLSIQFMTDIVGNYALELSVDDGELTSTETISIWVTPSSEINILPLGDSITQGVSGFQSYRYKLWTKLLDAELEFDLVGTLNSTLFGENPPPVFLDHLEQSFDPDHEGHSGWTADEILSLLPSFQTQYHTDVVLLHIGSNDMLNGVVNALPSQTVESTIEEIEDIIITLRDNNPTVTILMATPIPSIHDSQLSLLQAEIRNIVATVNTVQSKVILVDQADGFNAEIGVDTFDGIHPNLSGEEKIAEKWFQAIDSL